MALPPSQIMALIHSEEVLIYNTVAASVFIFWDYCITFGQEVELIWWSKFSLVNLLFFVTRYVSIGIRIVEVMFYTNVSGALHPSPFACAAWIWIEVLSGLILVLCVNIILIMRVFAFYGRNKRVLAYILGLFLCEYVAIVTMLAISVPKILVMPSSSESLPPNIHTGACLMLGIPTLFSRLWTPGLIFESILLALVIIRVAKTRNAGMGTTPHVLTVFVRDGIWGFTVIFATVLWIVAAFGRSPEQGEIALTWWYSMMGFCGSRMVLNLRSLAKERTPDTVYDTGIELDFAKGTRILTTTDALTMEIEA